MSEEYEKQFLSWFAKFITQTQKPDYESICKKAFMAGYQAAQQSAQADLPTRCHECEELTVYGSSCHNALCPSASR